MKSVSTSSGAVSTFRITLPKLLYPVTLRDAAVCVWLRLLTTWHFSRQPSHGASAMKGWTQWMPWQRSTDVSVQSSSSRTLLLSIRSVFLHFHGLTEHHTSVLWGRVTGPTEPPDHLSISQPLLHPGAGGCVACSHWAKKSHLIDQTPSLILH